MKKVCSFIMVLISFNCFNVNAKFLGKPIVRGILISYDKKHVKISQRGRNVVLPKKLIPKGVLLRQGEMLSFELDPVFFKEKYLKNIK